MSHSAELLAARCCSSGASNFAVSVEEFAALCPQAVLELRFPLIFVVDLFSSVISNQPYC